MFSMEKAVVSILSMSAYTHTHACAYTHSTFMLRPGEILKVQRDHNFKWKTKTIIVIGETLSR